MLFLERSARLLLILHAVLGAATVAVSTHFFLWSRRWSRGEGYERYARGARWFAGVGVGIYLAQFALGNLAYPVYRVRVRAEFLESPTALAEDTELRRRAAAATRARAEVAPAEPAHRSSHRDLRGEWIARLFDVKEHWAALGLPLILVAAWIVMRWDPKRDPSRATRWLLLGATGGTAAAAWLAALIGLYVSAVRAIS